MPASNRLHIDRALQGIAIATVPVQKFIGTQILKTLPVMNATDKYWIYTDGWNWDKAVQTGEVLYARANRSDYDRIDWDVSTSTYATVEYGLEQAVDDAEQANADSPLDPLGSAASILRLKLMIAMERRIAALAFDTSSTFSSYTATPAAKWDLDTADPYTDMITARQSMQGAGTWDPVSNDHVLAIGQQVWDKVQKNPFVLDRIKYTSGALNVTEDTFARYMQVDKVLVGGATYNSAKEGATMSPAYVWGKYAGFYQVPKGRPGIGTPCVGFCPLWTKGNGGEAGTGMAVVRYRDETKNSWVVRVNHHTDEKVTQAASGYVFSAVVS